MEIQSSAVTLTQTKSVTARKVNLRSFQLQT